MRAISIRQPYVERILNGTKKAEFRSRRTFGSVEIVGCESDRAAVECRSLVAASRSPYSGDPRPYAQCGRSRGKRHPECRSELARASSNRAPDLVVLPTPLGDLSLI
jgi:hypothetical protein